MKPDTVFFGTEIRRDGENFPLVGRSIKELKSIFDRIAPELVFDISKVKIIAVAKIADLYDFREEEAK